MLCPPSEPDPHAEEGEPRCCDVGVDVRIWCMSKDGSVICVMADAADSLGRCSPFGSVGLYENADGAWLFGCLCAVGAVLTRWALRGVTRCAVAAL